MSDSTEKINFPELFFGLVAPIGADIRPTVSVFRRYLEVRRYRVIEIKVTDAFNVLRQYVVPKASLSTATEQERYETYIAYGNQLRATFGDEFLAASAIGRVMDRRLKRSKPGEFNTLAFLIYQFKRKEEINLLRSVYGRLFF
jgi:hypothetical protein